MTPDEVLALVKAGEGQRVEFKTSLAEERKAIESLCAFANADGGTVLVGVDQQGHPKGVTIGANTLELLSNSIVMHTDPPLYPSIDVLYIDGAAIVVARIDKTLSGEVVYAYGLPFIRVGRTNQRMSAREQRIRLQGVVQDDLGLGVRIHDCRLAGGPAYPAIILTVSVENFAERRNAFVDRLEVRALEPFRAYAASYEYRDAHRESLVKHLPINIPAGGVSERFKVIAHFDEGLASPKGTFKIEVAAVGPADFRIDYSELAAITPEREKELGGQPRA